MMAQVPHHSLLFGGLGRTIRYVATLVHLPSTYEYVLAARTTVYTLAYEVEASTDDCV